MFEKGQYIIYGVRGVCEIVDITTADRPEEPAGKLYYVLRPYYQKEARIVAPVDSEKTVTRPLLSKEEAQALLDGIEEVPGMELPGDRQKEAYYKCAIRSCDCRTWISMLKALSVRKKLRQQQGKRMTDVDERYFRTAEENLYSELSLSLGVAREEITGYIRERLAQ